MSLNISQVFLSDPRHKKTVCVAGYMEQLSWFWNTIDHSPPPPTSLGSTFPPWTLNHVFTTFKFNESNSNIWPHSASKTTIHKTLNFNPTGPLKFPKPSTLNPQAFWSFHKSSISLSQTQLIPSWQGIPLFQSLPSMHRPMTLTIIILTLACFRSNFFPVCLSTINS